MTEMPSTRRRSFLDRMRFLPLLATSIAARAGTARAEPADPERTGPDAKRAAAASNGPLYEQPFSAFQNKTLEQRVQELADREELRELLGRYSHQTARGMDVSTLYTDDGAFIVKIPGRPVRETRGREALSKLYGTMSTMTNPPKPQIHNSLLAISGDEATGICSNEVRLVENGQSIIGSGYYEDTFRRVNGRWKFVIRSATFFHWVPIQQGWATSDKPL